MRNIPNLPESQIASIQSVIDKMLDWDGRVVSLSGFEADFSHRLKTTLLHHWRFHHQGENSNLYFIEGCIPVRAEDWADPVTSEHAIETRSRYRFKANDRSWEFSTLFAPQHAQDLFNIFHFYASDEEINLLYQNQDRFIAEVERQIFELKIEDPSNPHKSISKHFNRIAKELSAENQVPLNPERIYEYIANDEKFATLESAKFVADLKAAVAGALKEFKVEDRQSLFQAASKIMDGQGYNLNHGQIKMYFAKMVSRNDKYALTGDLPQHYERDGTRAGPAIQSPKNIRVADTTGIAYAQDIARGGTGQGSSLLGSPYAPASKSGWQRFSFRKNFE